MQMYIGTYIDLLYTWKIISKKLHKSNFILQKKKNSKPCSIQILNLNDTFILYIFNKIIRRE